MKERERERERENQKSELSVMQHRICKIKNKIINDLYIKQLVVDEK